MITKKHVPKPKRAAAVLKKRLGDLTLGKLIRAIRNAEDETQEIFSSKLGISKQQLSDIENGRKSVSPKAAAGYAKELGYSLEQFITLAIQDGLRRCGLSYSVELRATKKSASDHIAI